MSKSFRAGFWRLADPKISLASMSSIFLGACAAAAVGPLHWGWLGVTALGIFAVEVAKNASGEIFDFDSGTDLAISPEDRSPFSGGKRVLVEGLLDRRQTILIAAVSYSVGILAGIAIALFRDPRVLWLGVPGLGLAYFYHAPPLRLSYRGLGELAVAIAYGPLVASGTYLAQRGRVAPELLILSSGLGVLIAAFLWINEFPDYRADLAAGKQTLVVALGRRRASRLFLLLQVIGLGLLGLGPTVGFPLSVLLGAIAIPTSVLASCNLWMNYDTTSRVITAQAQALQTFVLFAFGSGLGLILA